MALQVSSGFPLGVSRNPAPAEAGDFAGTNPRMSTIAGQGKFVAGPDMIVGGFAWADPVSGLANAYYAPGTLLGFVHRENQAIIVPFLQLATEFVQPGLPVTLSSKGDFWALFTAGATIGQKVYANALTGAASAAATGQGTDSLGITGSITAGVLTVTVDGAPNGAIAANMVLSGPGVTPGTYIKSLGSGTGGAGTYNLANLSGAAIADVTSEATLNAYGLIETPWVVATTVLADASVTGAIDETGLLTVSAVGSGVLSPGQYLSGTGIGPQTTITAQLSGTTGGDGTYQTTTLVAASSTTIAASAGKVGKITQWQTE